MVWQFSEAVLGVPQPSRPDGRGDSECIQYVLEFWNTTERVKTFFPPLTAGALGNCLYSASRGAYVHCSLKRGLENHVSLVLLGGLRDRLVWESWGGGGCIFIN